MITAKVIQDSLSNYSNVRIVTMELEYPRFIHSEFMTHRVFSRNAASSRAIPIDKMIKQVMDNPAHPVHWGANQAGMQAGEEVEDLVEAKNAWQMAASRAVGSAMRLREAGLHKQIVNRVLEPFQTIKTVVTATEWDNFFELRNHKDAQPEIQALAHKMKEAMDGSQPFLLFDGEWHVPYVGRDDFNGKIHYYSNGEYVSEEDALMISASCCAQVSYRLLDDSLEKAKDIYARLIESRPIHASPFEHQARASKLVLEDEMSGNLRGFLQYRKTLKI